MEYIVLLNETNFSKVKEAVEKNDDKKIILEFVNEEFTRKILEKININTLLINLSKNKDKQKERGSSFNQVLSKLCYKKKVRLGINIEEIMNADLKDKVKILGRVKQNINLSKKAGLEIAFLLKKERKKNSYDLKSLALVLGINTKTIKDLEIIYLE